MARIRRLVPGNVYGYLEDDYDACALAIAACPGERADMVDLTALSRDSIRANRETSWNLTRCDVWPGRWDREITVTRCR